jgi:hypothetical protein
MIKLVVAIMSWNLIHLLGWLMINLRRLFWSKGMMLIRKLGIPSCSRRIWRILRGNLLFRMMIRIGSIRMNLSHLLIRNNSLLINLLFNSKMSKIKRKIYSPCSSHLTSIHKPKTIRCFKIYSHFSKRSWPSKIENISIYKSNTSNNKKNNKSN